MWSCERAMVIIVELHVPPTEKLVKLHVFASKTEKEL